MTEHLHEQLALEEPPLCVPSAFWIPGEQRWGIRSTDVWPEDHPKPRTCSYCGCAHPGDVLALLRDGWEFSGTTKTYKTYVEPPGYHAAFNAFMAGSRNHKHVPSPVPPVKMYSNHINDEWLAALNAQVAIRRVQTKG